MQARWLLDGMSNWSIYCLFSSKSVRDGFTLSRNGRCLLLPSKEKG